MLDVKLLRENLDLVKERIGARGTKIDWEEFVAVDQERREGWQSGRGSKREKTSSPARSAGSRSRGEMPRP